MYCNEGKFFLFIDEVKIVYENKDIFLYIRIIIKLELVKDIFIVE